jgi:branched-chain amino acid transport system ATP-binding protein
MALLTLSNLQVTYGRAVVAVRDVSLEVGENEIVALLGPNGAGKSTVLKALSAVLHPEDGKIIGGTALFRGSSLVELSAHEIVALGLVHVPEGRRLFVDLSVEENLLVGGHGRSRGEQRTGLDRIYARFPRLKERRSVPAGYLSGGEQQMVAIGRALMGRPKLLVLDEPSLGLAPQIVTGIFQALRELRQQDGMSVLVVEQNASIALEVADRGYVLENGRVVLDGTSDRLLANDDIRHFYLGLSAAGTARDFRNIKHYKRRKRWLS